MVQLIPSTEKHVVCGANCKLEVIEKTPPPQIEVVLVKVPMQLSAPKFCSDWRNQLVTRAFFSPQLITSAETVPAVRGRFASSEVHCSEGYGFPGHFGTPAWPVPPFGL